MSKICIKVLGSQLNTQVFFNMHLIAAIFISLKW